MTYYEYMFTLKGIRALIDALADELSAEKFDDLFETGRIEIDHGIVDYSAVLFLNDLATRADCYLDRNEWLVWQTLDELADRLATSKR